MLTKNTSNAVKGKVIDCSHISNTADRKLSANCCQQHTTKGVTHHSLEAVQCISVPNFKVLLVQEGRAQITEGNNIVQEV